MVLERLGCRRMAFDGNMSAPRAVCIGDMALAGRLHPLLLHFPIALVIVAAVAELVAVLTKYRTWHVVAVANVRAGAVFAVAAAVTGWLLASSSVVDDVGALEWHRWIGTAAMVATVGAALASVGVDHQSPTLQRLYRIGLFWAAALVGVTGHLGARLVWGADFLRP
jgi:uncharacterized membrane protein